MNGWLQARPFGVSCPSYNERPAMTDKRILKLAEQEAQRFNHEYVGTEHLLLGLLRDDSGAAARTLKNLGVNLRQVRLEVEKILQAGPDMVSMGRLPFTPRAKMAMEYAIEESRNLKDERVGSEHLLLGLLRETEGVAAVVLLNLGVDFEALRAEVLRERQQRMIADGEWRDRLEGGSSKKWWQFWR
jgi:ATP-dependent Clp protease ATP-binding subunit ClpC